MMNTTSGTSSVVASHPVPHQTAQPAQAVSSSTAAPPKNMDDWRDPFAASGTARGQVPLAGGAGTGALGHVLQPEKPIVQKTHPGQQAQHFFGGVSTTGGRSSTAHNQALGGPGMASMAPTSSSTASASASSSSKNAGMVVLHHHQNTIPVRKHPDDHATSIKPAAKQTKRKPPMTFGLKKKKKKTHWTSKRVRIEAHRGPVLWVQGNVTNFAGEYEKERDELYPGVDQNAGNIVGALPPPPPPAVVPADFEKREKQHEERFFFRLFSTSSSGLKKHELHPLTNRASASREETADAADVVETLPEDITAPAGAEGERNLGELGKQPSVVAGSGAADRAVGGLERDAADHVVMMQCDEEVDVEDDVELDATKAAASTSGTTPARISGLPALPSPSSSEVSPQVLSDADTKNKKDSTDEPTVSTRSPSIENDAHLLEDFAAPTTSEGAVLSMKRSQHEPTSHAHRHRNNKQEQTKQQTRNQGIPAHLRNQKVRKPYFDANKILRNAVGTWVSTVPNVVCEGAATNKDKLCWVSYDQQSAARTRSYYWFPANSEQEMLECFELAILNSYKETTLRQYEDMNERLKKPPAFSRMDQELLGGAGASTRTGEPRPSAATKQTKRNNTTCRGRDPAHAVRQISSSSSLFIGAPSAFGSSGFFVGRLPTPMQRGRALASSSSFSNNVLQEQPQPIFHDIRSSGQSIMSAPSLFSGSSTIDDECSQTSTNSDYRMLANQPTPDPQQENMKKTLAERLRRLRKKQKQLPATRGSQQFQFEVKQLQRAALLRPSGGSSGCTTRDLAGMKSRQPEDERQVFDNSLCGGTANGGIIPGHNYPGMLPYAQQQALAFSQGGFYTTPDGRIISPAEVQRIQQMARVQGGLLQQSGTGAQQYFLPGGVLGAATSSTTFSKNANKKPLTAKEKSSQIWHRKMKLRRTKIYQYLAGKPASREEKLQLADNKSQKTRPKPKNCTKKHLLYHPQPALDLMRNLCATANPLDASLLERADVWGEHADWAAVEEWEQRQQEVEESGVLDDGRTVAVKMNNYMAPANNATNHIEAFDGKLQMQISRNMLVEQQRSTSSVVATSSRVDLRQENGMSLCSSHSSSEVGGSVGFEKMDVDS
ncbi:unnamed protein product [Amoebophrya sp. A120]|nr:unnamed protein product [Amoebophrya sp. A120]|eukprot:GSA120T00016991001.1